MVPMILAPILSSLASNGLGLLAKAVEAKGKEFIEEKLGVQIPEDGNLPPELIAQLKIKEMEHEEELLRLAIEKSNQELEAEKEYLADTQNARNMQVEALRQDDVFSKRFIYYLSAGCLIFTGFYIAIVTFMTIPEKNIRFVDTVLGFLLGTVVATIINFFLGTSRSSKHKDDTIQFLSKGGQDNEPTT